jgi:hypothetical protein
VWKVPAEGGEAVQLTRQGGFGPLESPDGKFIYYVKTFPTTGIWRIPVNGGDELQIVDSFKSEFKTDWAVVEDGIYFINIDAKPGVAIEFFDFATTKVRRIANLGKLPHHSHYMAVSPDVERSSTHSSITLEKTSCSWRTSAEQIAWSATVQNRASETWAKLQPGQRTNNDRARTSLQQRLVPPCTKGRACWLLASPLLFFSGFLAWSMTLRI